MTFIIGIDFGTTNSSVAILKEGRPQILENSEGARITPSVIAFTGKNEVLVGQSAKRQAVLNPHNTLFGIKRLMGRRYNDVIIQKLIKTSPFRIIQADNGDAWVSVDDRELAPPEISARLLITLKKDAEMLLGEEIKKAVITVPAYFSEPQRQAIKDTGRIAGFEVIYIINESTAAALAYGMDKKRGDQKIAVYDLGGGTFDISIVEVAEVDGEHQFEVLSTNGDAFLGGEDFDLRIVEFLVEIFKTNTNIDLHNDLLALQRMKEEAEKAKIALSFSEYYDINLPYIVVDASGPKHLNFKLTRAKLESLIQDLIERTRIPCLTALKDAGLKPLEIDAVILAGGQTRTPKVQEVVKNIFGKDPCRNVNPDEAIAYGAAILAGVYNRQINDLLLLDVIPMSLGIETLGGVMTQLIEKNTTIPTRVCQVFSTAEDNQSAVTIHVLQGENKMARDNKSLGRFDLADIPPAPRGVPQIEVTFDIDGNGILRVSAKDKVTGKQSKINVNNIGGLSEKDIQRMSRMAIGDFTQKTTEAKTPINATQPLYSNLTAEKSNSKSKTSHLQASVNTNSELSNAKSGLSCKPVRLFISYSHADEILRDELDDHLSILLRNGLIEPWHDRKIMPGDDWKEKIDSNLRDADIILLLISARFLKSDYCYNEEMKAALTRHDKGEARVVPIIVRSCAWKESPLAYLQVLPKDGIPIAQAQDHDLVWTEVVYALRTIILNIQGHKAY